MGYKAIQHITASAGVVVWLVLGAAAPAWAQPCGTICSRYEQGHCVEYTHSPCTSPSAPSRKYGAIAYSRSSGTYGYSHDLGDEASAKKTALKYCAQNAKDCETIVWFYNNCAAVAADGNTVSWGLDANASRAATKAVDQCTKEGGKKCAVKVSHCSR